VPSQRDIDCRWPLVQKHRGAVVDWLSERSPHIKRQWRFDREMLVDLYVPGLDLAVVASHFGVSRDAVTRALVGITRRAWQLEHAAHEQRRSEEGCWVVVPVRDEREGDHVLAILRTFAFQEAWITDEDHDD
jgi:hypothetical protein